MASVKFNTTEILDTTHLPRFIKHESIPDRDIVVMPLARDDGDIFIAERYGQKRIVLQGILTAATQSDLETAIDTFKNLFRGVQKNLDITWAGGTRRYVATCVRHDFDRDYFHLLFVPWTAEFVVPSGEGKDTSTTTPLNESVITITTPASTSFSMLGSKPARPLIKLEGSNWPTTSAKGIEFKNTDSGEKIVFTRSGTWQNTDIIRFYCDEKKATFETGSVETEDDFFGIFPNFDIGTNNIKVSVGSLINQESLEPSLSGHSGANITSTTFRRAQSFMIPKADDTFKEIVLALSKTGSPGNLTVRIETDNGNKPSGSLADANATFTITAAEVGASLAYVQKASTNLWSLQANTKYWIVVSAAGVGAGDYYSLGFSTPYATVEPYAKGNYSYSDDSGSTYTDDPTSVVAFKVLYGGVAGSGSAKLTVSYTKTYL